MFSVTAEAIAALRANVAASNVEARYAELKELVNERLKSAQAKLRAGEDVPEISIPVRAEEERVGTMLATRLRKELAEAGFSTQTCPDEEVGALAVGRFSLVVRVLFG